MKGRGDGSKVLAGGWGFSSVVERLPSKLKALGSVLSSKKKKKKKKKKKEKRKKKKKSACCASIITCV